MRSGNLGGKEKGTNHHGDKEEEIGQEGSEDEELPKTNFPDFVILPGVGLLSLTSLSMIISVYSR